MLKKLSEKEVAPYINEFFTLASDPTKSGYPAYFDGIKTKSDFVAGIASAFRNPNEEILLFSDKSKPLGWIHFYWFPKERHLGVSSFLTREKTGEMTMEFAFEISGRFSGYDAYLGFPTDNSEAMDSLLSLGFAREEASHNDVIRLRDYLPKRIETGIDKIGLSDFSDFEVLHRPVEKEMYWTSERIKDSFGHWNIFLLRKNGKPNAAIYFTDEGIMSEVFGVDFAGGTFDGEAYRALMTACLNESKKAGTRWIDCFADEKEHPKLIGLGFRHVGDYALFHKKLV